jgi:hypothetical protein
MLERLERRFAFEGIRMTLATVAGPELAESQSGEEELMPFEVLDACLYLYGAEKLAPDEVSAALGSLFPALTPERLAAYAAKAADLLGLDPAELEHLLWDRIMHRELTTTGKSILVDKTPANASFWPRLRQCWPDARFIFLLRHPASIVASYMRGHDDRTIEGSTAHIGKYIANIESARAEVPGGLTVRYEDLTSDPEGQTRQLCSFLGVDWDPNMVNYGEHDHGPFRGGVGDWSKNIRSGRSGSR